MRGKNILWLSLISMLLASMLMVSAHGAPATKIFITPTRIPEGPASVFGHPGDEFYMSVEVSDIVDLWSTAFIVQFAPFSKTLAVGEVKEGAFLKYHNETHNYKTSFTYTIDTLNGRLAIGITRLKTWGIPLQGASGSGVLATFKFSVIDGGESDYDLTHVTLLDRNLDPIPAAASGGYYHGCTANLIMIQIEGGRNQYVGGSMVVNAQGINKGDVPVCARVRFDIERLEDGRRIRIYTGQDYAGGGLGEELPFTYLYVDGYRENPLIGDTHEWNNEGDSMVGPPDGNYMYANTAYAWSMFYSFEDLTLAGRVIANVDLYGYTSQPEGSEGWDFDPYVMPWGAWCDSMGGSSAFAWTGGRYYKGGPYDMPEYYIDGAIHTEEGINSAEVFIENYCPSGPEQRIDAMRWKVEFSPIVPVDPVCETIGPYPEEHVFAPFTIGTITEDMVGTYIITATLEYTIAGTAWVEGAKTRTISFSIE